MYSIVRLRYLPNDVLQVVQNIMQLSIKSVVISTIPDYVVWLCFVTVIIRFQTALYAGKISKYAAISITCFQYAFKQGHQSTLGGILSTVYQILFAHILYIFFSFCTPYFVILYEMPWNNNYAVPFEYGNDILTLIYDTLFVRIPCNQIIKTSHQLVSSEQSVNYSSFYM